MLSGSRGLRSKVASITAVLMQALFRISSSVSIGRGEGPEIDMVTGGTRVSRKRQGTRGDTGKVIQ